MKTKKLWIITLVLVMLGTAACGTLAIPFTNTNSSAQSTSPAPALESTAPTTKPIQESTNTPSINTGSIAALEGILENIYSQVNPEVVNIQVTSQATSVGYENPFPFSLPSPFDNQQGPQAPTQISLGSGFIWDTNGYIVTNNHVVDGAEKIMVTLSDGMTYTAELVGQDPDSDLAVVKIKVDSEKLQPVTIGDSDQVKVGQLAIAIGNPFGLQGTMTVGIISALDRSLPATSDDGTTTYTIPDIIQTDAPINPGNSGGVLLNANGEVIGVTAAIESSVKSSAGIGFVVPANIVKLVVPELIDKGSIQHPWLGVTAGTLTSALAKEMDLSEDTRGVLVVNVTSGSPADKGGLKGSDKQITLDGTDYRIGGDIIISINGQATPRMEDLVSYLMTKTKVGQTITLDLLRNGKPEQVEVTLMARPVATQQPTQQSSQPENQLYLGIRGIGLSPDLAKAIGMNQDIVGVLVVQVVKGSPADKAGLKGGFKPVMIQGTQIMSGGDIITALDGQTVESVEDILAILQTKQPGDKVTLDILRDGKASQVEVTLEAGIG